MFLTSASFKHFKSLDNVDVEFSTPITVLVGPNAVGKSNVVDGLRFVRDAVAVDLEHAVSKRGGIGRVRQYSPTRPYKIGVELRFKQSFANELEREAKYEFSILSKTQSNYLVDAETLVWFDSMFDSSRNQEEPSERTFARSKTGDVQHSEYGGRAYRVPVDQLALGTLFAGARDMGWPVERFMRAWRFSSLYPNLLREPSSPDKDTVLTEDGKNWASVIKALKRTARGRAALERVFEAMRAVIPSFEDVSVSTVGSYLVPRFRFRTKKKEVVDFDPVQLSDGTLRIFGILLALYQVPAPQLLLIEEPEQTVHPGVLGVLADAFREASETTQIIVTTHSPHFVDYFAPEEVRVVSLTGGLTHLSRIKKTQFESVKEGLMSMQEFMLAEGLLPEAP